jgi:hypothetical protein
MRIVSLHRSPSVYSYAPVKYGFIWAPCAFVHCAQLYSLAETPQPLPFPSHLGSYKRALLIIQDIRHLFVTLCRAVPLSDVVHSVYESLLIFY